MGEPHPVEQLFWAEIRQPKATRRSIAVCYVTLLALAAGRHARGEPEPMGFWLTINRAIMDRFGGIKRLSAIKDAAWSLHKATVNVSLPNGVNQNGVKEGAG